MKHHTNHNTDTTTTNTTGEATMNTTEPATRRSKHRLAKSMLVLAATVGTVSAVIPVTGPAFAADDTIELTVDGAPFSIHVSPEEMAAARAFAQERFPEFYTPTDTGFQMKMAANSDPAVELLGYAGQLLFKMAGKAGAHMFSAYLMNLFAPDTTAETLADMGDALDGIGQGVQALDKKLTAIHTLVVATLDGVQQTQFIASDTDAGNARSDIAAANALVAAELAGLGDGEIPSATTMERIANLSYEQVWNLDEALFGTTGSVALLQQSLADELSGDVWDSIDAYRDRHRLALGQAAYNLQMLAEWSEDYATEASAALVKAEQAMAKLDAIGVSPRSSRNAGTGTATEVAPIDAPSYLHINGADWMFADGSRPKIGGEKTEDLATYGKNDGIVMEDRLTQLRDYYVAHRVDDTTFEDYLIELGYGLDDDRELTSSQPLWAGRPISVAFPHYSTAQRTNHIVFNPYHYVAGDFKLSIPHVFVMDDEIAIGFLHESADAVSARLGVPYEHVSRNLDNADTVNVEFFDAVKAEVRATAPYLVKQVTTNDGGYAVFDNPVWVDTANFGLSGLEAAETADGWHVTYDNPVADPSNDFKQLTAAGYRVGDVAHHNGLVAGSTRGQELVSLDIGPRISAKSADGWTDTGAYPAASVILPAAGHDPITVTTSFN